MSRLNNINLIIRILVLFLSLSSVQAQFSKREIRRFDRSYAKIAAGTETITLPEFYDTTVYKNDCLLIPSKLERVFPHYTNRIVKLEVHQFYISKTEVSNLAYREFESHIRLNDSSQLKNILPDTGQWSSSLFRFQPYTDYYYRHPAYDDYPVVCVSYEQANAYLEWLTKKYNSSPKRKFRKVKFRLPTEYEWMVAYGSGADGLTSLGSLRNSSGQFLANFRFVPQTMIYHGSASDSTSTMQVIPKYYGGGSSSMVTTPVESYWPNGNGLFNMMGNVSEMVAKEGIAKGGSWHTTGFNLQVAARECYQPDSSSPTRGFRWVLEVIEE